MEKLFPAPKAGLHCGRAGQWRLMCGVTTFPSSKSWAPLRHAPRVADQQRGYLLFPAPKAGLHCGAMKRTTPPARIDLFPAPKAGLHCGMAISISVSSSRPAFSQLQKLGSIAGGISGRGRLRLVVLFLSPKAGLHCGYPIPDLEFIANTTFPSSKSWAPLRGGRGAHSLGGAAPFPSSKSWAPLRGFDDQELYEYAVSFSQLQKLGSIATILFVAK